MKSMSRVDSLGVLWGKKKTVGEKTNDKHAAWPLLGGCVFVSCPKIVLGLMWGGAYSCLSTVLLVS